MQDFCVAFDVHCAMGYTAECEAQLNSVMNELWMRESWEDVPEQNSGIEELWCNL